MACFSHHTTVLLYGLLQPPQNCVAIWLVSATTELCYYMACFSHHRTVLLYGLFQPPQNYVTIWLVSATTQLCYYMACFSHHRTVLLYGLLQPPQNTSEVTSSTFSLDTAAGAAATPYSSSATVCLSITRQRVLAVPLYARL